MWMGTVSPPNIPHRGLHNLGVSNYLEVNGNSVTSKHPCRECAQPLCKPLSWGEWEQCHLQTSHAGSLPNLDVSHHLEVNGNSVASKHPTQSWRTILPTFYTLIRWACDILRHCPTSLPFRTEGRNYDHSATSAQLVREQHCVDAIKKWLIY